MTTTITIKLWVDHLWTQLLLVRKKKDTKISPFDLTPVGTKTSYHKKILIPTEFSKRKENRKKSTYQRIKSQNQVRQSHYRANLIRPMTENIANKKANDVIEKKH